jgi:NAD(P)H dehydrogenase (quinone)
MVKALVLFHSQEHGNTGKMAEAVAEGLRKEGCEVTFHNANQKRLPIETYAQYDCVALGTPDYYSYVAGTMKTFMDDWYLSRNKTGFKGKPYTLFYSHGGGGKVREAMLGLFKHLGSQVGDPVSSYGEPTKAILEECVKLGSSLAKAASKTH